MEKLDPRRREQMSEATSAVLDICNDFNWRTQLCIQDTTITRYPELIENPYITENMRLVNLLTSLRRERCIDTFFWRNEEITSFFMESEFDPKNLTDLAKLDRKLQCSYIMELCWLQSSQEQSINAQLVQMLTIFNRTHIFKETLFRILPPESLRVYYKWMSDSGDNDRVPLPVLELQS